VRVTAGNGVSGRSAASWPGTAGDRFHAGHRYLHLVPVRMAVRVGALVTLFHDVAMVLIFSVTQLQVD
jgi:hypothetical protein